MKSLMYETPEESEEDLIVRIAVADRDIAEKSGVSASTEVFGEAVQDEHRRWETFGTNVIAWITILNHVQYSNLWL